ncbi:Kinesin-like protein like protein, partial [Aduncisulcus paluster]
MIRPWTTKGSYEKPIVARIDIWWWYPASPNTWRNSNHILSPMLRQGEQVSRMSMKMKKNRISVYARIRPLLSIDESRQIGIETTSSSSLIAGDSAWNFTNCFGKDASNQTIFQNFIPMLDQLFSGINGSVLAFGGTGSGKTTTICGFDDGHGNITTPGIIPLSIKYLFDRQKLFKRCLFSVSLFEIYNEGIFDLLNDRSSLSIHSVTSENGNSYEKISGLTNVQVSSLEPAMELFLNGIQRKSMGVSIVHSHSSRAHTIFRIRVVTQGEHGLSIGELDICDLCGSEQLIDGADSEQSLQTKSINTSLLALSRVISSLATRSADPSSKEYIPYRDSCLTRALRNTIGGQSNTCIVLNIAPALASLHISLKALHFGQTAMKVKLMIKANSINWKKEKEITKKSDQEDLSENVQKLRQSIVSVRSGKDLTEGKVGSFVDEGLFLLDAMISGSYTPLRESTSCSSSDKGEISSICSVGKYTIVYRDVYIFGHRIRITEIGNPASTPFFSVHGTYFFHDAIDFFPFIPAILQCGYKYIGIDMPGFGGSPGPRQSLRTEDFLSSELLSHVKKTRSLPPNTFSTPSHSSNNQQTGGRRWKGKTTKTSHHSLTSSELGSPSDIVYAALRLYGATTSHRAIILSHEMGASICMRLCCEPCLGKVVGTLFCLNPVWTCDKALLKQGKWTKFSKIVKRIQGKLPSLSNPSSSSNSPKKSLSSTKVALVYNSADMYCSLPLCKAIGTSCDGTGIALRVKGLPENGRVWRDICVSICSLICSSIHHYNLVESSSPHSNPPLKLTEEERKRGEEEEEAKKEEEERKRREKEEEEAERVDAFDPKDIDKLFQQAMSMQISFGCENSVMSPQESKKLSDEDKVFLIIREEKKKFAPLMDSKNPSIRMKMMYSVSILKRIISSKLLDFSLSALSSHPLRSVLLPILSSLPILPAPLEVLSAVGLIDAHLEEEQDNEAFLEAKCHKHAIDPLKALEAALGAPIESKGSSSSSSSSTSALLHLPGYFIGRRVLANLPVLCNVPHTPSCAWLTLPMKGES